MSGKGKTISVIAIGILLASSLIAGVSLLQREGFLPEISSSSLHVTVTSSSESSSQSGPSPRSGTLVLQIHDPPNVPSGVTAINVNYTDIWIAKAGIPDAVDLRQTGIIDLMAVVNFTQTIANLKVPVGIFDSILMNISSVTVTFYNVNYTAVVSNNLLKVPIIGGLNISSLSVTGAVIDIFPTLIEHTAVNSTGGTTASFVLVPSASAYVIPPDHLGQVQSQVGGRDDLRNQSWLTDDIERTLNQTSFVIAPSVISNTTFFLTVENTGNSEILIQSVFISAGNNSLQRGGDRGDEYNIGRSVIFTVLANGTLVPLAGSEEDHSQTVSTGYALPAHATATLSYSGQIPSPNIEQGDGSEGVATVNSKNSAVSGHTLVQSEISDLSFSIASNDETLKILPGYQTMSEYTSTTDYSATLTTSSNDQMPFQIISGKVYTVGASSGSVTATLAVVAS